MGITLRWLAFCSCLAFSAAARADEVSLRLPAGLTRPWAGADCWTNPMEDWQVSDGKLENVAAGGGRSVVLLTCELSGEPSDFEISVDVEPRSDRLADQGFVGFLVGLAGQFDDYRDSAVYGTGLAAGISGDGRLFIGSPQPDAPKVAIPLKPLTLRFAGKPGPSGFVLSLTARKEGAEPLVLTREGIDPSWLVGLTALAVSTRFPPALALDQPRPARVPPIPQERGGQGRFAFSNWTVKGAKVVHRPERAFGPVLWSTHTLANGGTLKLLAQLAPVDFPGAEVALRLDEQPAARAAVDPESRTALFKVPGLDTSKPHSYEVIFTDHDGSISSWQGTIRAVPDGPRLVMASLSCNDATGFPHNLLVRNVLAHQPDFVTFHGDQIYEGIGGYGLVAGDGDRSILSYLRKFYMHGWTWRELLRDVPSITIPDDHDVFHGNLWGCGGRRADLSLKAGYEQQDSGGYKQPPRFVNAVHRTQTGNLPDPYDPVPCESGVSVYYTSLQYGPIDVAVVADRQWKSAPKELLPDARIENGWPQNLDWDPKTEAGHPLAQFLGERQEDFLSSWADHPMAESPFRLVVSQSPWVAAQTLPRDVHHDKAVPGLSIYKPGEYAPDDEPKPDFDTNGWPQAPRLRALRLLAKAGALHVTGDQHLGSTGQYGLDAYGDGPYWISTPATANTFPRRWMPSEPGGNRTPDAPRFAGQYQDAFGNLMTILAIANPADIDRRPARLFDRAVGYAVITFDRPSHRIQLATWPYSSAPDRPSPDHQPYPGWPIEIPLVKDRTNAR
jgi:hypothetical protein